MSTLPPGLREPPSVPILHRPLYIGAAIHCRRRYVPPVIFRVDFGRQKCQREREMVFLRDSTAVAAPFRPLPPRRAAVRVRPSAFRRFSSAAKAMMSIISCQRTSGAAVSQSVPQLVFDGMIFVDINGRILLYWFLLI